MTHNVQERGLTVEDQVFMAESLGIKLDTTTEDARLATATQLVSAMRWLITGASLPVGAGDDQREVTLDSLARTMIDEGYGNGWVDPDQAESSDEARASSLAGHLHNFFVGDYARELLMTSPDAR